MADDIVPDDKDWTWVLEERCGECGYLGSEVAASEVAGLLRQNVEVWPLLLGAADAAQRRRADRWSTLEYACHVRDVFRLFAQRLQWMLDDDGVAFPNWDQDATAVSERYGEQDPAVVAGELVAAGERLATAFEAVTGDQWSRRGLRSDGASFTVETFARYFLHDPVHHRWDIEHG